ncbi:MAG: HU family DNA-binding protein, partial [Proteobacteria bacterium]|nr:HU family DNA-binding protein [Pseudomonadota bacterium]
MATKTEIIDAVAGICDVSKAEAQRAVDAVFVTITDNLTRGEEVRLTGFGSFSVAQRSARSGRNPKTGETIQIKASKQPKFKPGSPL